MQTNEKYQDLLNLIKQSINLPSPPASAMKIINAVQKDESALTELGQIISADPSLTAKMLKVANSPAFARNGKISSIDRAMTLLGTNLIKNIALSFVIAENLQSDCSQEFDIDAFWRHSITSAVAAELIAKMVNHRDDDIFVAALLQHIGQLIIAMTKGEKYNKIRREALNSETELWVLESENYGFNSIQVGYTLLASWKIPETITEPILYQQQPEACNSDHQQAATILYYADQLSAIYHHRNTAEKARLLQKSLVKKFDLTNEQAGALLDDTATSSREVITTFEFDPQELRPYSTMLQEANEILSQLNLSSEQMLLEMQDAKEKAEQLAGELQGANNRLKELVYRDGLTGLYNHRYFQESLANELARSKRYLSSLSLILFDVDHFKKVNDTYGHPAGDIVLMNIARAVCTAVRPSDIVARYGGEEFAVILPETNAAGAKVFAARLRRCVEGIATLVEGQLIYVTISAGTTTYAQQSGQITKNDLIETADRGLYSAKQNGRNRVIALETVVPTI